MMTVTAEANRQVSEPTPPPAARRRRLRLGRGLAWVYVFVILFITLFPFYWILRTSLSNNYALPRHPSSPLPVGFTFGPYLRVFGLESASEAAAQGGSGASIHILHFLRTSVIYATLSTA
jgi:ABC-type glycerol-3-phosphate transport system permease component